MVKKSEVEKANLSKTRFSESLNNPSDDILLDSDIVTVTNSFLKSGRIPHAIMLSGNISVGKFYNALFFTKKLLSHNPFESTKPSVNLFGEEEEKTFDISDEVENLVENSSHPDLHYITRDNEKSKNITIDQIRELTKFLSLTPSKSSHRVAIINPIDDLNISSSNAILKALEEPTRNTVLLLLCHDKQKVLDTIKSRCLCLDIKNPTKEVYFEYLQKNVKNFSHSEYESLRKISNNSPYMAKQIKDSGADKLLEEFYNQLNTAHVNPNKITYISKKLKDDKSGSLENYFYALFLNKESDVVKETRSITSLNKWFDTSKTINDAIRSNLDTADILKNIINIYKY